MRRRLGILALGVLLVAALLAASGGRAYLSDRPEACASCHVMEPRLTAWKQGPHARVATCVDCHAPAGAVTGLATKAGDGLRHTAVQVSGRTPRFLHLKREAAFQVLQANCVRCHGERVDKAAWLRLPPLGSGDARTRPRPETAFHADGARACTDCHRATGHRAATP